MSSAKWRAYELWVSIAAQYAPGTIVAPNHDIIVERYPYCCKNQPNNNRWNKQIVNYTLSLHFRLAPSMLDCQIVVHGQRTTNKARDCSDLNEESLQSTRCIISLGTIYVVSRRSWKCSKCICNTSNHVKDAYNTKNLEQWKCTVLTVRQTTNHEHHHGHNSHSLC
jgi:hypothetical protein